MVIGLFTLVGVGYAVTPVPEPRDEQKRESAVFYYSDGKTEIGRIGQNRELVTINEIPEHVRQAVVAAENRSFWTDPGFSMSGIARAAWTNVKGGELQGGSTITQQLAKNYYLSSERSMSRKFKELFVSVKLGKQMDKKKILEDYLNVIYFGRDSYGIQAASKTFFGKPVSQLKPHEGALLAAIIQRPGQLDPRSENEAFRKDTMTRYQYVLDGMVKTNVLSQADFQKYKDKLPVTEKLGGDKFKGDIGFMITRAKEELSRQGVDEQTITKQSLHIVTTFDKKLMKSARDAAEKSIAASPRVLHRQKIRVGLVAVDPRSGEVPAFYGGHDYLNDSFDNVWKGSAQAGSAMKPYVMATALQQKWSLKTLLDGRTPSSFDLQGNVVPRGKGYDVDNGHATPPIVDMVYATSHSINTAYVQLAMKVKPAEVAKTAERAGIHPSMLDNARDVGGIALGINDVRPIEQAAGYATFANGGRYVTPHVISKIYKTDGKTPFKAFKVLKRRVFDEGVAADSTYAMQAVVKPGGTAPGAALPDGRPVAGKTGTTEKNVATWFVGYVPQMSTAVTVYNEKKKTLVLPGEGEVFGGTVPAKIWRSFMVDATRRMKIEQFPEPVNAGNQMKFATPKPTPTPTPSIESPKVQEPCRTPRDFFTRPECRTTSPTPTPTPGGTTPPAYCRQNPKLPGCPEAEPGNGGNTGQTQTTGGP